MRNIHQKVKDRFGDRVATLRPGEALSYYPDEDKSRGERYVRNFTKNEVWEIFSRPFDVAPIPLEED
jgi:hypothetical protein